MFVGFIELVGFVGLVEFVGFIEFVALVKYAEFLTPHAGSLIKDITLVFSTPF